MAFGPGFRSRAAVLVGLPVEVLAARTAQHRQIALQLSKLGRSESVLVILWSCHGRNEKMNIRYLFAYYKVQIFSKVNSNEG